VGLLFFTPLNFDAFVETHFANHIEQFRKKVENESCVINFKLFEDENLSFWNSARRILNQKIAHGENKIRLFTRPLKFPCQTANGVCLGLTLVRILFDL